jgi:23S rRNA (adenine2503-C2)-methyltransferase
MAPDDLAPRLTPRELVDHGDRYARLIGHPVQFQWTLLEGVNDGIDEMDGIVELLKGKHAVLNMIPYNTTAPSSIPRPLFFVVELI